MQRQGKPKKLTTAPRGPPCKQAILCGCTRPLARIYCANMSEPDKDQTSAIDTKEVSFRIENLGSGDRVPYVKADLVQACRIGYNYALSFYQMDYQDAINSSKAAESRGDSGSVHALTMPVAKVVLDRDGFKILLREIIDVARRVGIEP